MHDDKQRRWLGRGVPPSQPTPSYLAQRPQPNRTQFITQRNILIAISVVLVLAIASGGLFYQWKSTRKVAAPKPVLGELARGAASIDPLDMMLSAPGDWKITTDILSIEKVWIDSCARPGRERTLPEQCDRQPTLERAVVKAVVLGAECMPERPKEEKISFAFEVNHRQKTTRLFAGRSGTMSGAQAKPVIECVKRNLAEPDWDNIQHDHTRYVIGVLARYPAQKRQ